MAAVSVSLHAGPQAASEPLPILLTVTPPAGTTRTPSDICAVVDISGSMGTSATVASVEGITEGLGLSVLDVVKHSLTTIIRTLTANDRLALVAYSNNAATVFELTVADEAGQTKMIEKMRELTPAGMTNLWDGLKTGLEVLKAGSQEGQPRRFQHVLLFTDGLPNINPPRGIMPMLKRLKDKEGGTFPCTINTFGFGYELDSELLAELAIEGNGQFNFIPDAGFVGTVFVNAMSNLLVTMGLNTVLVLEPRNGASIEKVLGGFPMKNSNGTVSINLGSIQYGQTKDVVFLLSAGATPEDVVARVSYTSIEAPMVLEGTRGSEEGELEKQRCRLLVVECLRQSLHSAKLTAAERGQGKALPLAEVRRTVQALSAQLKTSPASELEEIKALLEDIDGQVMEALSREDWYLKWGIHYLPSLMFAHLAQQCNNFKDAGVQFYGGDLFMNVREKADDIFLSQPAPTPSLGQRVAPPLAPPPQYAPAASVAAPVARVAPPAPVDMSMYYDRYSG